MSMDATQRALTLTLVGTESIDAPNRSDLNGLSDEDLLERIRHRDHAAALVLFQRYDRLAFSIGSRILEDQGEAEDLAQEIFLRLSSEPRTFDRNRGSARTWIIQMIYRRAFDRRAYLRRRQFYTGTDSWDGTNAALGGASPEGVMIDRMTVQQLKAAFCELSDRQRATLEAFFFEGRTFAEIASRSNEDVRNVRHHYYRGLERLRQLVRTEMARDREK